jgi:hypothetical protein
MQVDNQLSHFIYIFELLKRPIRPKLAEPNGLPSCFYYGKSPHLTKLIMQVIQTNEVVIEAGCFETTTSSVEYNCVQI